MDTKEISREQISALADGELVEEHINIALTVLRQPEEQITWDLYHQIGDVLRSGEMVFSLSEGFAAKMSKRLEAEPAIIVPQLKSATVERIVVSGVVVNDAALCKRFVRRFAMSGAAVAVAVVALVFVTSPQQAVSVADSGATASLAIPKSGMTAVASTSTSSPQSAKQGNELAQQGEVTRDPRIDDYLLAHQRFSPSMYSSVQYARSAAFAIDSDK